MPVRATPRAEVSGWIKEESELPVPTALRFPTVYAVRSVTSPSCSRTFPSPCTGEKKKPFLPEVAFVGYFYHSHEKNDYCAQIDPRVRTR